MQLLPATNRVVPGAVEAMSMTELTVLPKIRYAATVAREVTSEQFVGLQPKSEE